MDGTEFVTRRTNVCYSPTEKMGNFLRHELLLLSVEGGGDLGRWQQQQTDREIRLLGSLFRGGKYIRQHRNA
ncbi:Hypothetical protein NTJ_15915 [Nesidiocoris tenuis]|uniref:Uncharacterized protein n=1 Tax=Nesidiocoris tenuis TaxID=355587 RepID=A0ABN7BI49_9HEMI|nr:Hypothetical protein NTJ_15915 [Nesidiocoris tenuis]